MILFTGGGGGSGPGGWRCLQFFGGEGCLQFFGGEGVLQIFFSIFFPRKILLGCTNPPSRDVPCAGGTHPTGMHSCKFLYSGLKSGVGHILGYDYKTESAKIQQEMKKLFVECEAAQRDIVEEIEERKLQFNSKVRPSFRMMITEIPKSGKMRK